MEISIERVAPKEYDYFVKVGVGDRRRGQQHTIITTTARNDSDVKDWIQNVLKLYGRPKTNNNRRRNPLLLSLCADRSISYANGRCSWRMGPEKEERYELIQMCVENHCLVLEIDELRSRCKEVWFPKYLKDFLHDGGVTVVGVGMEVVKKRMEKDYGWFMPNLVELRDLAVQWVQTTPDKKAQETKGFGRFGVAKLARILLGEEWSFVKPNGLVYWDGDDLSDDMVKFGTVEAFVTWQMGTKLLTTTKSNH